MLSSFAEIRSWVPGKEVWPARRVRRWSGEGLDNVIRHLNRSCGGCLTGSRCRRRRRVICSRQGPQQPRSLLRRDVQKTPKFLQLAPGKSEKEEETAELELDPKTTTNLSIGHFYFLSHRAIKYPEEPHYTCIELRQGWREPLSSYTFLSCLYSSSFFQPFRRITHHGAPTARPQNSPQRPPSPPMRRLAHRTMRVTTTRSTPPSYHPLRPQRAPRFQERRQPLSGRQSATQEPRRIEAVRQRRRRHRRPEERLDRPQRRIRRVRHRTLVTPFLPPPSAPSLSPPPTPQTNPPAPPQKPSSKPSPAAAPPPSTPSPPSPTTPAPGNTGWPCSRNPAR